jgi:hypothetical protein
MSAEAIGRKAASSSPLACLSSASMAQPVIGLAEEKAGPFLTRRHDCDLVVYNEHLE